MGAVLAAPRLQRARPLEAHEIPEAAGRSGFVGLLAYYNALVFTKAALEGLRLHAKQKLCGISERHGCGPASIDGLPDMIDCAMHDTDLIPEIERIAEALRLMEDA